MGINYKPKLSKMGEEWSKMCKTQPEANKKKNRYALEGHWIQEGPHDRILSEINRM
jgi:hypothetical protein